MRVLVVGSGGREHALCWKLAQSPLVDELFCAPGNPGIAEVAALVPTAPDEIHELAAFASDLKIDLTIVGPELPLSLGIADEFAQRGLRIFGPRKVAAELESSKVFAKEFMARHSIPTAEFSVAHDIDEARRVAKDFGLPVVLKADGLAAGKGVIIPQTDAELETALRVFFEERRFGSSADRVVVEQFLVGEEVSFIALADGERVIPLATSKDYKRIGDGDTGPNTGGMGAHSPAGLVSADLASEVLERVIRPTVQGMAAEGRAFKGFLYAGLILADEGPKVLEYNVRLGDPEAQALLLRMEDDPIPVLVAGADGDFSGRRLHFRKEAAVCLVLASEGYPDKPKSGEPITGIEQAQAREGVEVFQAGTARSGDHIIATGGRVLNVCASGPQLVDALKRAYAATSDISWPSKILRRDIGRRVLERS